MTTVFDVANYFLSLVDHDADDCISNLKLQKLCYYAQGFYMAQHNGERLFNADLQAWQHGPVIPELYHKYKGFHSDCLLPDSDFNPESIPEPVRELLDDVYQEYGQYSAWRLRDMTHEETPWRSSYNRTNNDIIPDDVMTSFFKTRLA